jgi:hypothetical protein
LNWEDIALNYSINNWVEWVSWVEEFFYCSLSEFGDIMESISWVPFESLLYEFYVGVAALIILDRSFPFVLMIGGILGKAIVDSGVKILKNSIIIG